MCNIFPFRDDVIPIGDKNLHDAALQKQLDLFDEYYNWNRYPIELYGYAPMEVLEGAIPDKHKFKDDIKKARQ